jgi:tetratricopeptide (TPR) repeat protein
LNLGRARLLQKNFDGAIRALTQAVTVQPTSAEANYFLGDAYLQVKKGSKAVGYLYEALRLEPAKMAEAHLLLAALYNGAGLKDKAAVEYEHFLKKQPDYAERKKLERYIAENKKP